MTRRIKGGTISCLLLIKGVCPHCRLLVGDVYKVKKRETELMQENCKYQSSVVEISRSEIEDLPRLNCNTGTCARKAA